MEIYFYRHGQTYYNEQGIVQGRGVNSSLNEVGQQQASAFFEHYKTVPFDLLLTSTLDRTIQTAATFEQAGIPVERRSDLDEISWGIYEGKPTDVDMRKSYKGLLHDWSNGDYEARIPNGDSANDMQQRLSQFIAYIKTLTVDKVLVCTHGGCLGFLMAILQNQPLSAMPQYKHGNTNLCLFEYDALQDKFELIKRDDSSHLPQK